MSEPEVVEVTVDIAVSPAEAYRYWTDPAWHSRWMGRSVRLDPRPGGEYFVEMNDGFAALGSFVRVEPTRRVEFSWGWAPGAGQAVRTGPKPDELLPPGASRVLVALEENDHGTRLRLEHHDLGDQTLRDNHQLAWETYLARLVAVASGGDPGPEPHAGT
jgi:uncharacterized protein YndB with AHSA1/START domain